MGKLTYLRGDALDSRREILAHGTNALGVFGAGFAAQVARRWPHVADAYRRKYRDEGWATGDVQLVRVDRPGDTTRPWFVANVCSQHDYGRHRDYVDYPGLSAGLDRLFGWCEPFGFGVAMPKIGAGLAGGDWPRVEGLIRDALIDRDIEVDVYEL
jgi:O-acetyl-ADP-ribose deacetylase (regulator of RNase III)